ncbi:MAG: GNAT family N-acetyltransferase [Anaerolineae bacterium]|nr:GNAT family N-acetyltransferase [Anaerolineae bacterium]
MDVSISRATVDDAAEILALQKLAYRSEAEIYGDYTIQPLTQTLEETLAEFEAQTVLKAVSGEYTVAGESIGRRIVGSVRGYERDGTCYIGKLIVHPDAQNQGLGARLMRKIEACFPHVERCELFTGSGSEKNLYLYRKLGYQTLREQQINEQLALVFLEKRIS